MMRAAVLPLLLAALGLVLLSCALPCAQAQTLLASADGYSIHAPLRLQGVDVGSTLTRLKERLLQQQELIDELMRRNATNTALLQQYEQTFEQLEQTINKQQTRIEQQRTRIEEIKINSTVILPVGGSSSVVQIVTQQQSVIDRLVERNNTVQRELDGVGEQIDQLGDQDAQLAQQIQQLNSSLTAALNQHDTQIRQLNTTVDALLTPTIVHAVAGSEQATVRWSLASTTVTASPGGATCETDGLGGDQQCIVLGLTNGVNYTFTAQLRNAAGLGHVSPRSNEVMPLGPCFALTVATAGDGGVVTASPANSALCPAGEYTAGTLVTLTAIPDAGFGVSWAGPPSGVADAALLTFALRMPDAAETVVAAFAQCFTLTVGVLAGSGSAIIAAPSKSAGCAAGSFVAGASVTLKATAAAGWAFSGWSGTVTAGIGTAVWSFVMPASAATQRATFAQCMPLTVSRQPADGSGGSVSLSPSNTVGCPPGRFLLGGALTLAASPAAGWGFAGWTGTLTSSAATWSYTMGSAAAVQTAQFGQCFPLTLTATGPAGSAASASPPNSDGCVAGSYASGAALSLSATVPVGSTFLQWSGSGASGVSSSLTYIMPAAAATVTAELVVAPCYSVLTSVLTPDGTVSLSPSNSPGCAPGSFYAGTAVNVTAVPSNNYLFLQWGGAASGTDLAISLTVTVSVSIEASFAQRDFVYGQQVFTMTVANYAGVPARGLSSPRGLVVNSADELFVADLTNNRVLVYPFGSLTPSRVIGQADFTTKSVNRGGATTANSLSGPDGLALDASGGLLVADQNNNRVLYFPPGADSSTAATRVYGQNDAFTTSVQGPLSATSLAGPAGIALGDDGVFIADASNHRVLFLPGTSTTATRVYGQAGFTTNAAGNGATGLNGPRSLVFDASSGGIYVNDRDNYRIVFFPAGQSTASRVIGQLGLAGGFTVNRGSGGPTVESLNAVQGMLLRADGLYVCDNENRRLLRFPLSDPSGKADRVWGQVSFTNNAQLGLTNVTFKNPSNVAFDSKGYMYVSDDAGNRVLRFNP